MSLERRRQVGLGLVLGWLVLTLVFIAIGRPLPGPKSFGDEMPHITPPVQQTPAVVGLARQAQLSYRRSGRWPTTVRLGRLQARLEQREQKAVICADNVCALLLGPHDRLIVTGGSDARQRLWRKAKQ